MAVFFIFLIGVFNLGLGFGVAVVVKRRYDSRIAAEPSEQEASQWDAEDQLAPGINETAEEAADAVEELLNQVGLQSSITTEGDAPEEGDSGDDEKTDSENAGDSADSTTVAADA